MAHSIDTPDDSPRLRGHIVFGAFVAAFVLRFGYLYLDDLTRARAGTLGMRLMEELTGILASALLFAGVVWLERLRPLDAGRWRVNVAWHLGGVVLYSAMHTTLLALSRFTIAPMVGLGAYDYGILSIRYVMEAAQDVLSYASFIAVLTLLRVHRRLQREQLHAASLARDAAEARLEALSLRLQPHFLFNALNTISSAVYESPVAADIMIGHLGDLLRHALRTGDRPEISVAEELDVLRAYLAIVEVRFGDRVRCDVEVDAAARALAVPAFLLQPLVENAARHGSAVEGGMSRILVRMALEGRALRLVVENDVGPSVTSRGGSGTGLRTTAQRLRLLYGDDHELVVGPIAGGARFRVSVRIPARPAPASHAVASSLMEPVHAGSDR
jgi:hypothetical protein